jgi:hypothetical protein
MNEENGFEAGRSRDPITGEPGFHPIATVAGGASGAMTGAAIGAMGGPVGIVLGAAAGGLIGGLAGDALVELLSPSRRTERHASRSVADSSLCLFFDELYPIAVGRTSLRSLTCRSRSDGIDAVNEGLRAP